MNEIAHAFFDSVKEAGKQYKDKQLPGWDRLEPLTPIPPVSSVLSLRQLAASGNVLDSELEHLGFVENARVREVENSTEAFNIATVKDSITLQRDDGTLRVVQRAAIMDEYIVTGEEKVQDSAFEISRMLQCYRCEYQLFAVRLKFHSCFNVIDASIKFLFS